MKFWPQQILTFQRCFQKWLFLLGISIMKKGSIAWFKIEKNQHNSALLLLDIIYILKWHFMANFLHVHKYGSTRNVVCKHAMLNYDKLCFPFQTDWSFRKLTSLLLLLHNDVLCHRNCKHGKYRYCVLEIKP